jgi:hypothetical protein
LGSESLATKVSSLETLLDELPARSLPAEALVLPSLSLCSPAAMLAFSRLSRFCLFAMLLLLAETSDEWSLLLNLAVRGALGS